MEDEDRVCPDPFVRQGGGISTRCICGLGEDLDDLNFEMRISGTGNTFAIGRAVRN